MSKQNCWDYKSCGREPGGSKTKEMGVCPAAELSVLNFSNYIKSRSKEYAV